MARVNFTEAQLRNSKAGRRNQVETAVKIRFFQETGTMIIEPAENPLRDPVTFPLEGIPAVRPTYRQLCLVHIPDHKLDKHQLYVKNRIVRAESYKRQLRLLANGMNFVLPDRNVHITFHLPMPQSWSKDRKTFTCGKPHTSKPDWDNLAKLFQDALRGTDAAVSDCRVSKYWCYQKESRIVVSFQP